MKPKSLSFKNQEVYIGHCTKAHDKTLAEIEFWIAENFGMMVTESYRKQRHPNDLHGTEPVRAKDIRSWCYESPESVAKAINDRWAYDLSRPDKVVAFYHNSGQGAHIHLQTHPKTVLR